MNIFLLLAIGLLVLVIGGDMLVHGAADFAKKLGLSPLVIGLTLVGFGTSTPELVTSLQAAFSGSSGIAVGNVVGSNIANILLILGVTAIIAPIVVQKGALARDGAALAASTLMCVAAVLYGRLSPPIGLVFVLSLAAYVAVALRQETRAAEAPAMPSKPLSPSGASGIARDLAFVIGGLILTVLGARWLVSGAISAAQSFGVSETIIGLTVVAVGTSLPEFVTSIAAARRNETDIAFGNIVGSNIFNVLFILGVTAVARPIHVPASIAATDIWVMAGATALLLIVARSGLRISRHEGFAFLAAYVGYTAWLTSTVST